MENYSSSWEQGDEDGGGDGSGVDGEAFRGTSPLRQVPEQTPSPILASRRRRSGSIDLAGDGKLGYGFTSADELEEIDIGPGDKPRPTFISKKLDPHLRSLMIALLKEYPDCFAWDYTEMPGLDRASLSIGSLKKGFRPAASMTDEGRNPGRSQERDRENVERRIHQAMQQDRPFYIYLSVADTSIASVVVQVYDGLERVVFYLSRRMLDAETRYPEIEKLCLCLFFTCTKIQHILLSAEIIVICKSDVIKHMLSAPVLKGRLGKWMFALSEFDIRYQPEQSRDKRWLILLLNE
ncbi:hypothetical protein QYE76_071076 [Lolium multiflorum]|uniref:Reverse transcriptase RNase H-like domain-containing protein n=1 Tax=Lolium multiflorum TaxID=4521 RepID=A0AAD8SJD9_LOLMU|nr:hypothetical protein QYE76_071076 [Lolium multiflorum]